MDGHRVEMGPGDLMMGEDQYTRERDGRKGHLSGTVGDRPVHDDRHRARGATNGRSTRPLPVTTRDFTPV